MLRIIDGQTRFDPNSKPTFQNQVADAVLSCISKIRRPEYMDKPTIDKIQKSITDALSWLDELGIGYFVECFGDKDTLEVVTFIDHKDVGGTLWNTL